MMLRKDDINWIPFENTEQQRNEADIVLLSNGSFAFVGGIYLDWSGAYFTEDEISIDEYNLYITHYATIIDRSSFRESK